MFKDGFRARVEGARKLVQAQGEIHYLKYAAMVNCSPQRAAQILKAAALLYEDLEYEGGTLKVKEKKE
ncbi:MAG: hypothetical protein QXY50_02785 [Candidatus Caldarchaeum sp.]